MKKFAFFLLLICLPAVAQILSPIFFQSPSNVIGYCATPGYPAAPTGTPQFWYSADCITFAASVCGTPANGTSITAWADRSGNARDASRTTATATFNTNQINSLPAVTTSGSAEFTIGGSAIGSNSTHTLFGMLNYTSGQYAVAGTGIGQFFYVWNGSPLKQHINAGGGSSVINGSTTLSAGTWYNVMAQETGGSSGPGLTAILHVNETLDSNTTIGSGQNLTPPNRIFWDKLDNCCGFTGLYAELIYYNQQLSASDIVYNECYLYGKYGR